MFRPVWSDAFQVCFSLSSLYSARRMHPYQNMLYSAPSVIVCYYYNAPQKLSLCSFQWPSFKKQKKKKDTKLTRKKKGTANSHLFISSPWSKEVAVSGEGSGCDGTLVDRHHQQWFKKRKRKKEIVPCTRHQRIHIHKLYKLVHQHPRRMKS